MRDEDDHNERVLALTRARSLRRRSEHRRGSEHNTRSKFGVGLKAGMNARKRTLLVRVLECCMLTSRILFLVCRIYVRCVYAVCMIWYILQQTVLSQWQSQKLVAVFCAWQAAAHRQRHLRASVATWHETRPHSELVRAVRTWRRTARELRVLGPQAIVPANPWSDWSTRPLFKPNAATPAHMPIHVCTHGYNGGSTADRSRHTPTQQSGQTRHPALLKVDAAPKQEATGLGEVALRQQATELAAKHAPAAKEVKEAAIAVTSHHKVKLADGEKRSFVSRLLSISSSQKPEVAGAARKKGEGKAAAKKKEHAAAEERSARHAVVVEAAVQQKAAESPSKPQISQATVSRDRSLPCREKTPSPNFAQQRYYPPPNSGSGSMDSAFSGKLLDRARWHAPKIDSEVDPKWLELAESRRQQEAGFQQALSPKSGTRADQPAVLCTALQNGAHLPLTGAAAPAELGCDTCELILDQEPPGFESPPRQRFLRQALPGMNRLHAKSAHLDESKALHTEERPTGLSTRACASTPMHAPRSVSPLPCIYGLSEWLVNPPPLPAGHTAVKWVSLPNVTADFEDWDPELVQEPGVANSLTAGARLCSASGHVHTDWASFADNTGIRDLQDSQLADYTDSERQEVMFV